MLGAKTTVRLLKKGASSGRADAAVALVQDAEAAADPTIRSTPQRWLSASVHFRQRLPAWNER
jgi:hypothetical protein